MWTTILIAYGILITFLYGLRIRDTKRVIRKLRFMNDRLYEEQSEYRKEIKFLTNSLDIRRRTHKE